VLAKGGGDCWRQVESAKGSKGYLLEYESCMYRERDRDRESEPKKKERKKKREKRKKERKPS
jgi:hypothetical protein